MKRLSILLVIVSTICINARGQPCVCNFSYSGTNDTLAFTNLSTVLSAHYYWDFGDGASSYATNPIHQFPESGSYLVTLYAKDTVSNCHNFYENWITVNKATTETCQSLITDTIITSSGEDYLIITNLSVNCSAYNVNIDGGPAQNFTPGWWIPLSNWSSAVFVSRVQYFTYDSINPFILHREYYKTSHYHFYSNVNYDSCSANFEFITDYQPNGARVYFSAMNQRAMNYDYLIDGFGSPVHIYSATGSYFYPYYPNERYSMYLPLLITQDSSGCIDTVAHQLLIYNPYYLTEGINEEGTYEMKLSVYPNPVTTSLMIECSTSNSFFELTDALGQVLIKDHITSRKFELDVSNLKNAIYILSIYDRDKQIHRKVIKD